MKNRGSMMICVMGAPLFVCLCDVEGACSTASFYHVFSSSTGVCDVSWVFGGASLYDTKYRRVVGMSGRFAGAKSVD